MNPLDYLNILRHTVVRKKIFRNEAELALFSGKPFKLPPTQHYGSDSSAVFIKNYPLRFFRNSQELTDIVKLISTIEDIKDVTITADKICKNIYPLRGSEDLSLGEKIRWNYDYSTGYTWDFDLAWRRDYNEVPNGVNLRQVRQLGSLSQSMHLGKAYLVTQDEKYTDKFLSLISDFEEENVFCKGIHWADSSEIALRILNISFSLSFFIDSAHISPEQINKILNLLLQHCVYLENNLEYHTKRDSGYLICNLALAVSGLLFNTSDYGKKILSRSFTSFEHEIRIQVHKDGTSYEQSVPNHSLALEALYLAKVIFEKNGLRVSHLYNELLHKMFLVQGVYLRSDNSVPQIGEGISGRIVQFNLTDLDLDFSYPLPVGAYIFRDEELKCLRDKGTAELLFLFGSEVLDCYKKITPASQAPSNRSSAFMEGKHFIFRSEDIHLFIEAGETGLTGQGHNDVFSYDLFYKNKNFIVDAGSYSLNKGDELYRRFRSIKYHNSVYIDDEELTVSNGKANRSQDLTKTRITEWYSDDEEEILTAEHFAYTRFSDPVVCRRSVVNYKEKHLLKIKDELLGGAKHRANLNILFHPDVNITFIKDNEYIANNAGVMIKIKFHSSSALFKTAAADALYAHYGKIMPARKIGITLQDIFPAFILTEIELL